MHEGFLMAKFRVKVKIKPPSKKALLLAEGRRWVDFTISISTWERFVAIHCQNEKPGEVLNRMIAKAAEDG